MPSWHSSRTDRRQENASLHQSQANDRPPSATPSRKLSLRSGRPARSANRSQKDVDTSIRPSTPESQRRPSGNEKGVSQTHTQSVPLRHDPSPDHLYSSSPSSILPHNAHASTDRPSPHARKNSHGLSWSDSTRDSIVDNLLSSFDHIPDLPEDPTVRYANLHHPQSLAASPPRRIGMNRLNDFRSHSRNRAHAHSSSISSDHERPETSDSGRRPSMRYHSGARKGSTSSTADGMSHMRSFSRSESRSSDMIRAEIENASLHGGRSYSISKDPGAGGSIPRSESSQDLQGDSILARGRPVPSAHSMYATPATEPLVATGPGSNGDRSSMRKSHYNPLHANPAKPSNLRATSMHSIASLSKSSHLSHLDSTEEIQERGEPIRKTSSRNLREQSASTGGTPPGSMNKYSTISPVEEKRGFFKRVFGSSSSRSNLSPLESPPAQESTGPTVSRQGSIANMTPQQQSSPAPSQQLQALNKKSSSFFRRRKKSIDNSTMPPALPPLASKDVTNSPSTGSLYKAMNPYINGTASSPQKLVARDASYQPRLTRKMDEASPSTTTEDSEDPDIFHSGYHAAPEAALHGPAEDDIRRPSVAPSTAFSVASTDLALRSNSIATSPDAKMKLRMKEKPAALEPHTLFGGGFRDRLTSNASMEALKSPMGPTMGALGGSAKSPGGSPRPDQDRNASVADQRPDLVVNTASPRVEENAGKDITDSTRIWLEPSPIESTPHDQTFSTPHETMPKETVFSPKDASPLDAKTSATITSVDDLGLGFFPGQSMPQFNSDMETPTPITESGLSAFDRRGSDAPPRNMSVATAGTTMTVDIDERERAMQIYEGKDILVMRGEACSWLGDNKVTNASTLVVFMEIFNFTGKTVLAGMRMLCEKLALKGESQQVDRVLETFAGRWVECNPEHGFQLKDVVHTICYSLLLLNTDLHMADIESKMTRAQFVKNTLPTIKRVVAEASPGAFDRAANPSAAVRGENGDKRRSSDSRRPTLTKRLSWGLGIKQEEDLDWNPANSGSTALVNERFDGKPTEWHYELESILKSFFTAIKNEPLPLVREKKPTAGDGRTRRAGSIKSVAPSEMSMRSRKTDFHSMRWGKKGGIRSKFYAASNMASSRTSFDDSSSFLSPAGSSSWSRSGKTMTTMSSDSLGTHYLADQGFQQSIGFANALSQSNARDDPEGEDDNVSYNPQKFLLEDETLELAGAPWAKEGILKHKHHLEASEKKAKERNWNECFAVIEKGFLRLFSFNSKGGKSGSLGIRKQTPRGKATSLAPSIVGGGNWMQNAEQLGSFLLRQTIASVLPPPGYSKARPNVWALSLPSGAVHLFQVGTAEIATEFMNTANYWSARLSKEPLTGGVDNIEYGWSDAIVNPALLSGIPNSPELPPPPSRNGNTHSAHNSVSMPRQSIASSMRGSVDLGGSRARLPGDKAHLEDWTPPTQSMMASQLMEVDQLKALQDYVANIEAELSKHNDLRGVLGLTYTPRHPNAARAVANWEKKSSYLLRETVKFSTYIDALAYATRQKEEIYKERAEREVEKQEREAKKKARLAQEALARGEVLEMKDDGVKEEKKVSIEV